MAKQQKKLSQLWTERKIVDVQGAWGTLIFVLECGHIAKHQTFGIPTKTKEEYQEKQAAFNAQYQGKIWHCFACPLEKTRQRLRKALANLDQQLAAYEPEKPILPVESRQEKSQQAIMIPVSKHDTDSHQDRARKYETRPVTFTCQWCKEEVTELRYPSHTPLYCSKPACKKEATRVKTRERVAAWRKTHPNARRKA